jgi:hypothetical protein
VGTGGGAPREDIMAEAWEGEEEGGQVDFSGEEGGEAAGEPAEVTEPPSPVGLVWPGLVIGADDHGG